MGTPGPAPIGDAPVAMLPGFSYNFHCKHVGSADADITLSTSEGSFRLSLKQGNAKSQDNANDLNKAEELKLKRQIVRLKKKEAAMKAQLEETSAMTKEQPFIPQIPTDLDPQFGAGPALPSPPLIAQIPTDEQ